MKLLAEWFGLQKAYQQRRKFLGWHGGTHVLGWKP